MTVSHTTQINLGSVLPAKDDDTLGGASASAVHVPTQQSVKTYVDNQITAQDLDFQGDSGGAQSVDLDSETLTLTGGTGIDTTGSSQTITFAIDSTVATLTGSQSLTNKTLTGAVLNTSVSGTAILDEDNMASNSATQLATQQSIKTYADTKQPLDAELTALAGLTSAANKIPMFSGSESATLIDFKDENNMSSNSATAVASQQSIKAYVDTVASGLDVKDSCKAATTGNITIATALNNGDTLDGVTLENNDRVLVKDQSTASENGIYIVSASPARASDLAAGSDAAGTFTFVEQGTVNGDNGFVCTSNTGSAITGTNNLAYSQFSGAGQITAGDGLEKSGNTLSIDAKSNSGIVIDSTELSLNLGASSITGTLAVGDGGTGATTLNDLITLGTHTTGNYVATIADSGTGGITVANSGAESAAITLEMDIHGLTTAAIASGDFIAFSDEGESGDPSRKETIDDIATLFAGDGLAASSAVMSLDLKSNGGAVIESNKLAIDLAASSITGTLAVGDGGTGATSAAAARTALGVAIGTNVQAYDAQLADIAGLTPTDGNFIVGDGSNFVLENGATARTSLGLGALATLATPAFTSDVTIYDDANNADASLSIGTGAAEALFIQVLNGTNNKTAEEVRFTSKTASGTANHGKMTFYIDETNMLTVDDSGINVSGAITGNPTIACGNVTCTGAITATGDITAFKTSDKRLKENIKSIEDPLAKVKTIGGYTYTWNKLGEENSIHKLGEADVGVIAQEIEAIIPEAVADRGNGYKAVQYEKIIPLLVECVKEQQDMIEKLQNDLNMLKQ
tara:strand:+ start:421 stop:2829 length:2409 start_codon:yes stop_codon:yes gene_type:complete